MRFIKYSKNYSDKKIFTELDLDFEDNTVTAIMGNSGVGKTTLLNALARLDGDFSGEVETEPCSYIFQEPRLLKGATVFQNVYLACHDEALTEEMLEKVELTDYSDEYPKALSGGMAQRVSMARAFASGRKLLLMDEPFASLDLGLKHRLYEVFRTLWSISRPTTVFVTHDPDEALELGDRILFLKGSPVEIALDVKTIEDKVAIKEKLIALSLDLR